MLAKKIIAISLIAISADSALADNGATISQTGSLDSSRFHQRNDTIILHNPERDRTRIIYHTGPKGGAEEIVFELSAHYSISNNSLGASAAINLLHSKIALECPNGWAKLAEWSTPIGNDFNLHFEFTCLR